VKFSGTFKQFQNSGLELGKTVLNCNIPYEDESSDLMFEPSNEDVTFTSLDSALSKITQSQHSILEAKHRRGRMTRFNNEDTSTNPRVDWQI